MTATTPRRVFEMRCGSKVAYATQKEDGSVTIRIDCNALPGALVRIEITAAQFEAFNSLDRPAIQDIFPEMPNILRETLKMGTTPAEWHEMFGGPSRIEMNRILSPVTPKPMTIGAVLQGKTKPDKMAYYKALGYDFDQN